MRWASVSAVVIAATALLGAVATSSAGGLTPRTTLSKAGRALGPEVFACYARPMPTGTRWTFRVTRRNAVPAARRALAAAGVTAPTRIDVVSPRLSSAARRRVFRALDARGLIRDDREVFALHDLSAGPGCGGVRIELPQAVDAATLAKARAARREFGADRAGIWLYPPGTGFPY